MKEIYSCNNKEYIGVENKNNNFIYKEYKIYKEDLKKIKEYGEDKCFSLRTLIASSLGEIFSRWSDSLDLKFIITNKENEDLGDKKGIFIDYKCDVNEKWNRICSRVEEESNKAGSYGEKEISFILSDTIEERINENKKIIILSASKKKLENCNENDYYCHKSHLNGIYISEDKIPDAIIYCNIEKFTGDLVISWYLNKDVYTSEMCNDMEMAYKHLLRWIAKGNWNESVPDFMPNSQIETRKIVNFTDVLIKRQLLHEEFFLKAEKFPGYEAILWDENGTKKTITYGELANKALKLASLLIKKGVKQGDAVAITQPRGANQIVSALGILAAGAAYVPVGIKQPRQRRDRIYKTGGIKYVVACDNLMNKEEVSQDFQVVSINEAENIEPLSKFASIETNSLAYVIFTSGTTGDPKGVEITHEAAYNTIVDINTRFSIDNTHRTLNVSSFDFDLSVYDVFGMLSAGGGIVVLKEGEEREASIWSELVTKMKVTVWNSVPALFDMLLTGTGNNILSSLKLVLVSGDWVGLDLYERLLKKSTECRFVALGGATEASIWSNYYEVKAIDPSWKSIPYGKPLNNQCFRVVDKLGRDCPDMVPGELWIGGIGVAKGYIGNEELTSRSFIVKDGKRWYRTGDLGRYWSNGIIEFLGRVDHQVKLRGFRIELGEIEAALKQYEGVGQALASVVSNGESKHLVAAVVMDNIKGQAPSLLEKNEDIESYRNISREKQCEMAESLIVEILGLNNLNIVPVNQETFVKEFRLDREYEYLLKMWLLWLSKRNIIDYKNRTIYSGPRFGKATNYIETLKSNIENSNFSNEERLILDVEKSVLEKLEEYKNILRGEKSPLVLLDDDNLSPESVASKDSGTIEGIKLISDRIKDISRKCGKPVKVALIGCRNGIMAEVLLKLLQPCHIKLTLLDSASSMIKDAEERLCNNEHFINYEILKENNLPEGLRYSFDIALAINSLHRYRNPYEGIAIASLLLKNGGKIFALEHCELSPIALVTAAILEKGFKDLDHSRKEAFSSMLTPIQWSGLFYKAGFTNIEYQSLEDSFTEFIEGQCPLERTTLDTEKLLDFIKERLPEHMIPEKIEILALLPLTSNGKINRKELEKVFQFSTKKRIVDDAHGGMEKTIEDIWKRLIGVEKVNRNEGFFEIGGDSLLATRFIAEVKEKLGVELSLRNMFEKPLLHQVAEKIEGDLESIEQSACSMEEGEI